tara:strand:- start:597 stop:833 length:237 start_codon:yes stop_codon:yes gene_type:complete
MNYKYYKFDKALNGNLIFSQALNKLHPEATGEFFTYDDLLNINLDDIYFLVRKKTKSGAGFFKYKTGKGLLNKINTFK